MVCMQYSVVQCNFFFNDFCPPFFMFVVNTCLVGVGFGIIKRIAW